MQCDVCGNDYDKPLIIEYQGQEHIFDCFECAITSLAPKCANCNTLVIGHGDEAQGQIFCSANCAGMAGYTGLRDHI